MRTALLLVDIQNDYFPGGAMALSGSTGAAEQARILLDAFRDRAFPVIHIQHISTRSGATFFIPQTKGADLHDQVAPQTGEPVFRKHFPNSFRETPLNDYLIEQSVTHLVIAGMMTHMCIDTTTRAAFDLGFSCTLAHDACATRDLSFKGNSVSADHVHQAFLAALDGLFAHVIPVREIIQSL